jgi:hypothetical protein
MSTEPVAVGGIDPGPRPGLIVLHIRDQRLIRVERGPHLSVSRVVASSTHVAIERYVRGVASVRRADSAAQLLTEQMARDACQAAVDAQRPFQALPAGSVKPWADDERLRSYQVGVLNRGSSEDSRPNLLELTRGQGGHDRDAARHALNFAVKLGILPRR